MNLFFFAWIWKSVWLRIAFFHSENWILLMLSSLERRSAAPFIPSIIDDSALSRHIVNSSLSLGPLVMCSLSLLLHTIHRFPVKMWSCSRSINSEFSLWPDIIVLFWIKELMSKDSMKYLWLNSLGLIGCCNIYVTIHRDLGTTQFVCWDKFF